jgi:iron complex transport system permease protein
MKNKWFRVCCCGAALLLFVLLDLWVDKVIITPFALLHSPEDADILLNIRLPRVLTALLVGGIMGMCGTAMQIITHNELASPSTLGVSAGAGLGAALSSFGFVEILKNIGVGASAFLGAIAVSIPIFLFVNKDSRPATLVLTGVAISSLCNAGIAIAQYWATPDQVYQYIFWSMGDVQKSGWADIIKLLAVSIVGGAFFIFSSRDFDIVSTGETSARGLGIKVKPFVILVAVTVSLQIAVAVSIVGIIGFVGLVSPHSARRFLGQENRYVIPGSMMIAAAFLILADFLSHYFTYPVRFPIGTVTALFGAPFFLWIIYRRRGND